MLILSFSENGWTIEPLHINPMIGPSAETLIALGAKQTSLIVNGNEWYRIFSPMFLHAGVIHFVVNMCALWFIGSAVERTHGFFAAVFSFIIPGIGGNILSAIFLPQFITVGASGGIFGLIGACLVDIMMNWSLLFGKDVNHHEFGTTSRNIKIVILLMLDIGVNCLIGFTPLVDNFNHLGGMIFGILVGFSFIERISKEFFGAASGFFSRMKRVCARFFGLILCAATIMITIVVLAESDGISTPCPQCRYFSCLPFPFWKSPDERWWNCDDCGLVTADARKESASGKFVELILTCPDQQVKFVDISEESIFDENELSENLSLYCRKNCENVLS